MEQKSADKSSSSKKDENENRLGLLKQSSNVLGKASNAATPPALTSSTASATSPATVASPPVKSTPSASTSKLPATKMKEPETVIDLNSTLKSEVLREAFRKFLREKLDNNKSDNSDHKKMFEQWLDYVLICKEVMELPEDDNDQKAKLMIRIGGKFLAKPPDGYNLALKSQLNRKELEAHCAQLKEKVPELKPNSELIKDGFEFIFGKLDSKHDIFKKSYKPTTTLAALICSVL